MRKKNLTALILVISISVITGTGFTRFAGSSASEKNNSRKKKMELFNGKNLDGWYTYIKDKGKNSDPDKVFTVQNRLIRISGQEFGCITTNDEFQNYKLTVEFKWGELTWAPRIDKAQGQRYPAAVNRRRWSCWRNLDEFS